MTRKKQVNQDIKYLSYDMDEATMLGISCPLPAIEFVDKLNCAYELQLEYKCQIKLTMPKERSAEIPASVNAVIFTYYSEVYRILYILAQVPRFKPQQMSLFDTDPLTEYDKYLFVHGDSGNERANAIYKELTEGSMREVDVCDWRAIMQMKLREELAKQNIRRITLFDFRPQENASAKDSDMEDDDFGFKIVVHKKKKPEPEPAQEQSIEGLLAHKTFASPMAELGQRILLGVGRYYSDMDKKEREWKKSLLPVPEKNVKLKLSAIITKNNI